MIAPAPSSKKCRDEKYLVMKQAMNVIIQCGVVEVNREFNTANPNAHVRATYNCSCQHFSQDEDLEDCESVYM